MTHLSLFLYQMLKNIFHYHNCQEDHTVYYYSMQNLQQIILEKYKLVALYKHKIKPLLFKILLFNTGEGISLSRRTWCAEAKIQN